MSDRMDRPDQRYIRRSLRDTPIAFTVGPGDVVTGRIRDISIHGIGILTNRQLPVGTSIGIHVPGQGPVLAKYLAAEVRHSTHRGEGSWLLGCRLLRPFTMEEIALMCGDG
jgi:hypothetical protein